MSWNPERIDMLKKLWAEGHSGSQIATKLGGVTRNAVIGKIHRLGLTGRTTPSRPVRVPRKNFVGKQHATLLSAGPVAGVTSGKQSSYMEVAFPKVHGTAMVAVQELEEAQCKWPIGDPHQADFSFCSAHQFGDHPYCIEHLVTSVHPARQQAYRERLLQSASARAA